MKHVAYVDIDAHHGDGVFYAFEDDAAVVFADLHEDGRYLYPGTGCAERSAAAPRPAPSSTCRCRRGPTTRVFATVWPRVLAHLEKFAPEFIILQCGADSLEGDPITHLRFSPEVHGRAARELGALADRLGHGRVLALGGGGYNRTNLAQRLDRGGGEPALAARSCAQDARFPGGPRLQFARRPASLASTSSHRRRPCSAPP